MIVHRYRVFASDPASGNSASVVVPGAGCPDTELQRLAASEPSLTTVFVSGNRMRFFTASAEIGLCAHGLLAAAHHVLLAEGASSTTVSVGERSIQVSRVGDLVEMAAGVYVERPLPVSIVELWDLLGIDEAGRDPDLPACVGSIGSAKFLVPVRTRAALLAARPDLDRLRVLSRTHAVNGIYAYSRDAEDALAVTCARGSNPGAGVVEDPATGVGAGALCGALAARGIGRSPYRVEQGHLLGQRNIIHVTVDDGLVGVGGRVDPTESNFDEP